MDIYFQEKAFHVDDEFLSDLYNGNHTINLGMNRDKYDSEGYILMGDTQITATYDLNDLITVINKYEDVEIQLIQHPELDNTAAIFIKKNN